MKPYYQDKYVPIYHGDCRAILPELPDNTVDLLVTDPPYGIGFMGKDWDRALPDKRIWEECLRILKPSSFAFVMSIPRADCLSRTIISLEDAGFRVDFTPIFWAYATGFPKAQNIGKAVDKKLGAESNVLGQSLNWRESKRNREQFGSMEVRGKNAGLITEVVSSQAKALDGSYGGFQPKPAVEVIIVAMKPLSEKTFVDQALKNRKGITWLDDCRIPYENEGDKEGARFGTQMDIRGGNLKTPQGIKAKNVLSSQSGRFPANLIVSNDVLNDGREHKTGDLFGSYKHGGGKIDYGEYGFSDHGHKADSGSFSRYFDLDKWWAKTFPFLIVPKASKSEKNKGLGEMPEVVKSALPLRDGSGDYVKNEYGDGSQSTRRTRTKNYHPTVKPLKLMSYLITLGSRAGDTVLDPFLGSGTTALACQLLNRKCIGIEIEEKYCEIAANRCRQGVFNLRNRLHISTTNE